MPASSRLRTAGAVVAGVLLATVAPGTPAHAITPPITVAMSSTGAGAPGYEIRIRNDTDGTVRTTVRQELPEGAVPARVSEGGQTIPVAERPGDQRGRLAGAARRPGNRRADHHAGRPTPRRDHRHRPHLRLRRQRQHTVRLRHRDLDRPGRLRRGRLRGLVAHGAGGGRRGRVLALLVVLAGVLWIRRRRRRAARTGDTARGRPRPRPRATRAPGTTGQSAG